MNGMYDFVLDLKKVSRKLVLFNSINSSWVISAMSAADN